jgi:phosphate transport system substrate-binding protein
VTFNVEGVKHLRLTPDVLADIFLGKITKWSDPVLAKDNPGVKLPDVPMVTAHRSDGSGTTYVFTDYLSKVSPAWKKAVGRNTSVSWPVGLGGKGNEGVTGLVKQTPNSIGYVELIYAIQNKLPYAELRNAAGRYITPSLASVTAAAGSAAANMPADFRVSITNGAAPDAYPISSFTWLLIPTHYKNQATGRALKEFLEWMLDTGQTFTKPLSYAPLPPAVVKLERKALDKIEVGGQ